MKQEAKDTGDSRNRLGARADRMLLRGQDDRPQASETEAVTRDIEAARVRAEASFKKPEPQSDDARSAREAAERALREKTERLREARLAKEARERLGAEIRANWRRGT